jgi:hypothetical protein
MWERGRNRYGFFFFKNSRYSPPVLASHPLVLAFKWKGTSWRLPFSSVNQIYKSDSVITKKNTHPSEYIKNCIPQNYFTWFFLASS